MSSDSEKKEGGEKEGAPPVTTADADEGAKKATIVTEAEAIMENGISTSPTITMSLLVFWILPILILAIVSHFLIDASTPPKANIPKDNLNRPISVNFGDPRDTTVKKKMMMMSSKKSQEPSVAPISSPGSAPSSRPGRSRSGPKPTPLPSAASNWPTAYRETIEIIKTRDRKIPRVGKPRADNEKTKNKDSKSSSGSNKPIRKETGDRGFPRDAVRQQYLEKIDNYRKQFEVNITKMQHSKNVQIHHKNYSSPVKLSSSPLPFQTSSYQADPENVITAIKFADALRLYDVTYHDGGTKQPEALKTYEHIIQIMEAKRKEMVENGEETNVSLANTRNVRDEVTMDYSQKSVDGMLCALFTAKGKVYFMANMFERAVETYTKCLEIEPLYLDALGSRGSSNIILGRYEEAASDLMTTIENDEQNFFNDAYTGLARILQAKESAVPQGWAPVVDKLNQLIPSLEGMISSVPNPEGKKVIANTLNRLHHVMFTYHDVKTKDTDEAWEHLTRSYKHKMSALPPWQKGFEQQKIQQTMQIFHKGFWPEGVGSDNEVPIFIIGFVRSGSTLLERVLDAHEEIVGTGEDSVFNGRLDKIRNEIVDASMVGDPSVLAETVKQQADYVVDEMRQRWKTLEANTAKDENYTEKEPKRLVDKMLNNWANV